MKSSRLLRVRVICLASAQAFLLPCLTGATAWAQDKTSAAPGMLAAAPPAKPVLVSLELKDASLQEALKSLFTAAKAQYSVNADDLPDWPITLTIRDQSLENALRILLQQGSSKERRLTYTVQSGVHLIKADPPGSAGRVAFASGLGGGFSGAAAEPARTKEIRVTNVRASDIINRLQTAFPTSLILPGAHGFSLLVRGPEQQNQDVDELAHLLDSGPGSVVLKAEVILVTEGGGNNRASTKTTGTAARTKEKAGRAALGASRSTLLSTTLRTLTGQEATGDDKLMGSPAQSAKLQIVATPARLGIGAFQVDTRWDVSLPLPTEKTGEKGAGLVRLEKRLTTTTRLENGETALVGSVVLSQYGLKGEVLFFITLNEVRYSPPIQDGLGN